MRYTTFINLMKTKNIELDRKVLSQMAMENPEVFAKLVKEVK
jgi:large subunit ribosomal protein L20